jgi:CHAD domain-containing protein
MVLHQDRTQALFDKLQRISRRSSNLKAETVHQLRTTVRRIETIVSTTSDKVGPKERKLLKQLDRLRRRAGKLRDLDVQIEALGSLRLESVARDRAKVTRFLEKARAKRERKLLKAFDDEVRKGLHKRMQRTSTRLQQESMKPARDPSAQGRVLTAALDKFAAVAKQHATLTEDNLHHFRMQCKRVRYLAEMAGEGPRVDAVIEQLKRIQDSVGSWHDWTTLTSTAERVLSRSGEVPLLSALRAGTRSKFLEALRSTTQAKQALLEMGELEHKLRKPVSTPTRTALTSAQAAVA